MLFPCSCFLCCKTETCKLIFLCSVEKIHSVGTINNVETSYFAQLKMCCLMTTFRCPSDILITSWLFTAQQLDEDKNAPHRREHYGLIEVHSDNHVLLFQGRHIPTDVRCRYGDPNFPASSQFVYGMAGEAGYCHGTGWMQTKILEAVCGRGFVTDKEGSGEESYGPH